MLPSIFRRLPSLARCRSSKFSMETLERRDLLAVVSQLDAEFKRVEGEVSLAGNGLNFSGQTAVFEPGQRIFHDEFEGRHSERGWIEYTSPTSGAGQFSGAGSGSGLQYLTISGNVIESTYFDYSFEYSGKGSIRDNAGTLTRSGQSVDGFKYTSLEAPENGGGTPYSVQSMEGAFDTRDFAVDVSWFIDLNVHGAPAESTGRFNGYFYPDAGDFDLSLNPESVEWDGKQLRFEWLASGPPQKTPSGRPSHTTPVSQVQLYWARGKTTHDIIGVPILPNDAIPVYWNQRSARYEVSDLPAVPTNGATHLLIVADPAGPETNGLTESDESNNVVAIPITDVSIDDASVEYQMSFNASSDEIALNINSTGLQSNDRFGLAAYWAKSTSDSYLQLQSSPAYQMSPSRLMAQLGSDGTGTASIPLSALTPPPGPARSDYRYLVFHVDGEPQAPRDGMIVEMDEDNNFSYFDIRPDIRYDGGGWREEGGFQVFVDIGNRFFVPQLAPGGQLTTELYWTSDIASATKTSIAATSSVNVSGDLTEIIIPPSEFSIERPPAADTQGLVIVLNADQVNSDQGIPETNEANNLGRQFLENITPTVEFVVVSPEMSQTEESVRVKRKAPYQVYAKLTNVAAHPMAFNYAYREQALPEPGTVHDSRVWSYDRCTDAYDATSCPGPVEELPGASWSEQEQQVLNSGQTEHILLFHGNRTFNWVAPLRTDVDTTVDLIKEIFSILVSPTTGTATATRLNGLFQSLKNASTNAPAGVLGIFQSEATNELGGLFEQENSAPEYLRSLFYEFEVQPVAQGGGIDMHRQHVEISVPQVLQETYNTVRRAAQFAQSGYAALLQLASSKNGAIALLAMSQEQRDKFLESYGDIAELFEVILTNYRKALDPPDSDFQQHSPLVMDRIAGTQFWDNYDGNKAQLQQIDATETRAVDRLLGARIAEDPFWGAEHRLNLSHLAHERADRLGTQLFHERVLLSIYEDIAAAEVDVYPTQVQQTRMQTLLQSANIPRQSIDALLALSDELTGPFTPDLTFLMTHYDFATAAVAAGRELKEGVELGLAAGNLQFQPVSPTELAELTQSQQQIQTLLDQGIATLGLRHLIAQFIDNSRQTLLETADVEQVHPWVEFGYGAMFLEKSLATRPTEVANWLAEHPSSGEITAEELMQLQERLKSIEAHWSEAAMNAADDATRELLANVVRLQQAIPESEMLEGLSGYVDLLTAWGGTLEDPFIDLGLEQQEVMIESGNAAQPFATTELINASSTFAGGGVTVEVTADPNINYQVTLSNAIAVEASLQRIYFNHQAIATYEAAPNQLSIRWLSAATDAGVQQVIEAVELVTTDAVGTNDHITISVTNGHGHESTWTMSIRDAAPERVPGDINGDRVFDSSDIILAFRAGKYEDGIGNNATFEEGDWNGDGDFDSSDLVYVFRIGHYLRIAAPVIASMDTTSMIARPHAAGARSDAVEFDPLQLVPLASSDELANWRIDAV